MKDTGDSQFIRTKAVSVARSSLVAEFLLSDLVVFVMAKIKKENQISNRQSGRGCRAAEPQSRGPKELPKAKSDVIR